MVPVISTQIINNILSNKYTQLTKASSSISVMTEYKPILMKSIEQHRFVNHQISIYL